MQDFPDINNCSIAVLGLGYVGLPVLSAFANQKFSLLDSKKLDRDLIGYDINQERINQLKKGIDLTNEVDMKEINNKKNITFSNDINQLKNANVFIITVPTPIDSNKKPDLNFIEKACQTVGLVLKNKKNKILPVVIFESTVYPGTTEEICIPIIKSISGLSLYSKKGDKNCFCVGYSPERINPGDKNHRIKSIVKVTSGNTIEVSNWVDCLYGSIIDAGTYNAKNIKVAEAAKIIENTQRDLNIALINELSIIFKKLNIDTLDVINAAKTKWNFIPFFPGLVGGHCIGVDPYYLTYKSEIEGYSPEVILSGRKINDKMASWYVDDLILKMVEEGISLDACEALILGFTFKDNCPDIRNTKVIDIISSLNKYKIKSTVFDPIANKEEVFNKSGIAILNRKPKNKKYSLLIVAVSHDNFKKFSIEDWISLCDSKSIIFDIKGIVPRKLNPIRP